jgi:hypothetical protein
MGLRLTVWVEMRKSVAALTGPPQIPLGLGYLTPAHKPRPLLWGRPSQGQSPESCSYWPAPCAASDCFTSCSIFARQPGSLIGAAAAAR